MNQGRDTPDQEQPRRRLRGMGGPHKRRRADRRAEWQVSWGFRGRPVDCQDAETGENRSLEAYSLRTS